MTRRKTLLRNGFKPQLEALEDRCLPATQLMGSFNLGVGGARFWDGPVVHGTVTVPDSEGFCGGTGICALDETFADLFGKATDTPLCGQEGFPCWDYKLTVAEGGARLRIATDLYPLSVRPWTDGRVGIAVVQPLVVGNSYGTVIIDPQGNAKKENFNCFVLPCFYSHESFIDAPAAGEWTVRVIPFWITEFGFRMRAKLEEAQSQPAEPTPLYPNMRIIPPFEFTFKTPTNNWGPGVDVPGLHTGCMPEELVHSETGEAPIGKSCLRFSMGVENAGDGPMLTSPPPDPQSGGSVSQWLKRSDGTIVECDAEHNDPACQGRTSAGSATFEPSHNHLHWDHAWEYQLFEADLSDGSLDPVGVGHKAGFGPGDERLADWRHFYQDGQLRATTVKADDGTKVGFNVSTGWGDVYEYNRSQNYVDFPIDLATLSPVSGYYVLRGTVDPDDLLLETRDNDNVSYALIYVDRRNVYTCERGYGESPWDPNRKLARSMPTNEPPAGSGICDIGLSKAHFAPGDVHPTDGDGPDFYGLPPSLLNAAESDIPPASGSSDQPTTSSFPQMEVATVDDYFATSETEDVAPVLVSSEETTTGRLLLDDPLVPDPLAV